MWLVTNESGNLTQRTLVLLVLLVTVPSGTTVGRIEAMAVPPGECDYVSLRSTRVDGLSLTSLYLITKPSAGRTSPKVALRRFVSLT